MPDAPLNPDALDKAALAMCHYVVANREMGHGIRPVYHQYQSAKAAVSAYLAVAQPEVNSAAGVYDIGSPEPEGVDYVVECDEHGVATDYLCSDAFSGYWSKATDGTQWKGYQDGKVYMSWAELVRRVGPVKEVDDA